jgi:WS/DGAT/MGAT family acyltransferase
MTDAIMRATPALYNLAQGALRSQKEEKYGVPNTRFNSVVSPQKMFDARAFPLAELKAVRAAVPGSTINDVILAVCGGGLRRYLQQHDELPDEPLVAWVPINARQANVSDPDAPGNNVTSMTAPIYTNVEDPVERLTRIHRATQQSKAAKSGVSARLMTDLSKHVPASTQVIASRLVLRAGMKTRMCNLFVSNVPGPQVPLYMNGALQVGSYGLAPLANGMGLFIATPSYNGQVTFNVTSTRDIMPDIDFFVECLEESLNDLKAAIKPARKSSARKSGAKKSRTGKSATKRKIQAVKS